MLSVRKSLLTDCYSSSVILLANRLNLAWFLTLLLTDTFNLVDILLSFLNKSALFLPAYLPGTYGPTEKESPRS